MLKNKEEINTTLETSSKTPSKISIQSKKNDDDLILSMTKRLNLVEQNLKDANYKIKLKDDEILR